MFEAKSNNGAKDTWNLWQIYLPQPKTKCGDYRHKQQCPTWIIISHVKIHESTKIITLLCSFVIVIFITNMYSYASPISPDCPRMHSSYWNILCNFFVYVIVPIRCIIHCTETHFKIVTVVIDALLCLRTRSGSVQ